jgi:predicted acetyltransferase
MEHKPRNHVALALLKRSGGSGAHVKPSKSQRQHARQSLHRELKQAKSENF